MAQQSEHDEPLDRLAWIDEQASRFETAWRAGARPSIEGCAEKAPPDLKTALLKELILLDHELHQAAGRPSKAIDYRARFPELGEWLSSHLDRPRLERRDAETRAIPPVESPVESEQANLPRLTHYAISSILGKGGMGVVYLGRKRDRVEDHCLAVKMLHRSSSAEVRNRFLDEMATMARLQHPHIVPIIDSGYDHDHILYFVMPYFPAGDLAAALASSGPLPAATAAEYALAVAWALDYLHERGIVHRDLKLRNILLDEYRDSRFPLGRPWLADFGLVKLLETWTTSHEGGRITGTVMNMSPEQASGRNDEVGPRSDLWAVGVLLFELLTRRAPFAGESIDQVRYQIMRHEPMSVRILQPKTPRDLERIVAKCLEKNPDDRYASAAALIADLTAFLRNEPLPHATPKRPW